MSRLSGPKDEEKITHDRLPPTVGPQSSLADTLVSPNARLEEATLQIRALAQQYTAERLAGRQRP